MKEYIWICKTTDIKEFEATENHPMQSCNCIISAKNKQPGSEFLVNDIRPQMKKLKVKQTYFSEYVIGDDIKVEFELPFPYIPLWNSIEGYS